MAAGSRAYRDDPIDALGSCLLGMTQVNDIVEHHAAVTMHGGHNFGGRPQAGYDDGDLVLDAQTDIFLQAIIAAVHDLIDGERPHLEVRIRSLETRKFLGNLRQPIVELRGRPRIERWK